MTAFCRPPGSLPSCASPLRRLRLPLAAAIISGCLISTGRGETGFPNPLRGLRPERSPFAAAQPHPAVVRVTAEERGGTSHGSGTLVDVRGEHGLVVTNWHVIRDATGEIRTAFPDGFRSPAHVAKIDKDWDLAALVIWRPPAGPVRIAAQAPQPGQVLHIAGYGKGDYRLATGKCTQYVAPGANHPYEMVEVSVQARNGDSGGPIFNEQGELAGVLFGAASGSTSGSYCGRVRWFLESVWPQVGSGPQPDNAPLSSGAAAPPLTPPESPPPRMASHPASPSPAVTPPETGAFGTLVPVQPLAPPAGTREAPYEPEGAVFVPGPRSTQRDGAGDPNYEDYEPPGRPGSEFGDSYATLAPRGETYPDTPAPQTLRLQDLIGDTPIERAKLFLAAIGCLAIWTWITGSWK